MRKTITTYSDLFQKAWRLTWEHKELWIIAALAGLVNTGAVFHNVLRGFARFQPADQFQLENVQEFFLGIPWLITYLERIVTLSPVRIVVTIVSAAILLIAFALIIMAAQHLLVLGIDQKTKSKKRLNISALAHTIRHAHLWRLFAVNIIVAILVTITIALGSLILLPLLSDSLLLDTLAFSGVYALVLPILFILNALGMLSLVEIVRHDRNVIKAIASAWTIMRGHWLVVLETTLLLFIVNALASLLLILVISVYTLICIMLLFAAFNVGSFLMMGVVGVLGILGAAIIFIFYAGIVVSFNYSVWIQLSRRLERYGLLPGLEGIARWILRPLMR